MCEFSCRIYAKIFPRKLRCRCNRFDFNTLICWESSAGYTRSLINAIKIGTSIFTHFDGIDYSNFSRSVERVKRPRIYSYVRVDTDINFSIASIRDRLS